MERRGPKRRGLIGAESSGRSSKDLMRCPATRGVVALSFRRWFDSTVESRPMIPGWASDPPHVACVPEVLVGSSCRGVAGWSPTRRWPGTTRCNGLAVIVMRDGDPVSRGPLIASVRQQEAQSQSRVGVTPFQCVEANWCAIFPACRVVSSPTSNSPRTAWLSAACRFTASAQTESVDKNACCRVGVLACRR